MALDAAPGVRPQPPHQSRPLSASLQWGLGWTVLVASLGVVASGCATGASVDAPGDIGGTSVIPTTIESRSGDDVSAGTACVIDRNGTADAIEHHIAACERARRLQHRAR